MVESSSVVASKWPYVRRFLPFDLDGFAVEAGAFSRRRGFHGGEAFVRTLLMFGLPNSTHERVSVMAADLGIAKMNSTALFNRLRCAEPLLASLFHHTLTHAVDTEERFLGLRALAADATSLCGPGAKGTDQRLHTIYDLAKGVPLSVELTGPEGGEALWRHASFGKGDLILGDRGYGYNSSFHWALASGARILIRFNFQSVKLYDIDGQRLNVEMTNALVPETDAVEIIVHMPEWSSPLRAIGERNNTGEPIWLLTDLSSEELPTQKARELYRRRWQVELYFKRLKSLLDLDELPTRDGPTARPWIWAKLLLASLAVLLAHERFSPSDGQIEETIQPLEALRSRSVGNIRPLTHPRTKTQTGKAQRKEETSAHGQATLLLEA